MSELDFPILQKYGVNLTKLAQKDKLKIVDINNEIDDEYIKRIIYVMRRRVKNNPVIISEYPLTIDKYINAVTHRLLTLDEEIPKTVIGTQIIKLDISDQFPKTVLKILTQLIPFRPRSIDNRHLAVVYIANSAKLFEMNTEIAMQIYRGICRGELDCILGMSQQQYNNLIALSYPTNRKTEAIIVDKYNNDLLK